MERRLIEEMATMRGGRGRLEGIRNECEVDRERLVDMINLINSVLTERHTMCDEPVDSNGE